MSAARASASEQTFDVLIVGAGLVGLTAAIALSRLGKRVALLDAAPAPHLPATWAQDLSHWDTRIYALTCQTVQWLAAIGVWPQVPKERINPIHAMHLWSPTQQHVNPDLSLSAEDAHLADMGCIVESQALSAACWNVLAQTEVTVLTDVRAQSMQCLGQSVLLKLSDRTLTASLLLGADGARSWVRQQAGIHTEVHDFEQCAVVTNYKTELAHGNVARQWFGTHETLALLPMPQQQVSLVWALPTAEANARHAWTAEALAQAVTARSGLVLGHLQPHGDVLLFPLRQQTAVDMAVPNVLLLGDAAHQVHPMAGQGVNLGFQDVMALCREIQALPSLKPIGERSFLKHVARTRKMDLLKMHALTRGLDALFARTEAGWTHAAVGGMRGVQRSAMLKQWLIQAATGV